MGRPSQAKRTASAKSMRHEQYWHGSAEQKELLIWEAKSGSKKKKKKRERERLGKFFVI